MTAKLLFIHGTGEHDVTGSLEQIVDGARRVLQLPSANVVALKWGDAVGPADLDVTPALPLRASTRGMGDDLSSSEETAALWDLLLADPLVELRVLAVATTQSPGFAINRALPSEALRASLLEVELPPDRLTRAGVTADELRVAAEVIAGTSEFGDAADAVGDAADPQLVAAVARAVVASLTLGAARPGWLPRVAYDGMARDQLVGDVADALQPGTRGLGSLFLKTIVAPLATRIAVAKRADYMEPLSDFLRDVAFYIARGHLVREWLAAAIRREAQADPVVVLAHSLGGIAAVDLLSDPGMASAVEGPLKVDLLVTAGSQAPLLYLMDSLHTLRPGQGDPAPFTPWLNIYNRDDFLSFCAQRVWNGIQGIEDEDVAPEVPFPGSHSAYWAGDRLYELIGERLP